MATRGRPKKFTEPVAAEAEALPDRSIARQSQERVETPKRVKRVPLGRPRHIMNVFDADPNWCYRWINDKNDRIERAKQGGYEAVVHGHVVGETTVEGGQNPKFGSAVAKQVGGGMWAVLMRIPRELYEEDQAAKEQDLLKAERQMVRDANNAEGRYGGITGLNRREILK